MSYFFKCILSLLVLVSSSIQAQFYENLRESADDYLVALSKKDSIKEEKFIKLKILLFTKAEDEMITKLYNLSSNQLDSLKNEFTEYEKAKNEISDDSAFVLFNYWYLQLSNTFYNYAEEKFFSSEKVKILLFSASVSCACTLEMCRKQTLDIINFAKEKGYDYWIVDSYENNQLQIEYETLFAPSVIVLDENNKLLIKIQYDENMIDKLSQQLTKLQNQKS
uniref:Thioredoxin-like fold domain-containing protein n=1 Tax=Ignavibacterium album TaxID=591197 RepID=A0A832DI65_9BACT